MEAESEKSSRASDANLICQTVASALLFYRKRRLKKIEVDDVPPPSNLQD
jgi:hypothetical protein